MMISNCFYYGVYSPRGYYSLSARPSFAAKENFVVKGYSNALKQRLFEKIKTELDSRGQTYTEFCTADGCEGLYSRDAGLRIIDGTYGSCDYSEFTPVLLDGFAGAASPPTEISASRKTAVLRAERFLAACRCISNDMLRLDTADIDLAKINRFASRLWASTGGGLTGSVGTEHKRFVTCITPEGVELNMDAFDIYCERITVIRDKTGAASRRIIDRVRRYALSAGYDVISCICPMNTDLGAEHLIIPELKYGIFTSKHYHRADFPQSRRIFAGRFLQGNGITAKNRLDFSFKAYKRLMQEVFSSLEAVQRCDERLNEFYSNDEIDNIWKNIVNA